MNDFEMSINFSYEPEKKLRTLLGTLEEKLRIRARPTVFDWAQARHEMMKIVFYKHGPRLSQVGST